MVPFLLIISVLAFTDARRLDVDVEDFAQSIGGNQRLQLTCASGYVPLADRCYKFHQSYKSWHNARSDCTSESAHLASVMTQEQYDEILAHINAHYAGTYWTSGAVVSGTWIWTSDGSQMNSDWWGRNPGTASGQCAYFCSNTLKYWNKSCARSLRFICEKAGTMTIEQIPFVDVQ